MRGTRAGIALLAALVAIAAGACGGSTLAGDGAERGDVRSDVDDEDAGSGADDGGSGSDGGGDVDSSADGVEAGDVPALLGCGNGVVDPDEECDDGNRLDGDGCDWLCRIGDGEPPGPPDETTPTVHAAGAPTPVEGDWESSLSHLECYRVPFFWTDRAYAIVWGTLDGGGRFTRFDRAGARVGADVLLPNSSVFDAAFSGASFALVWCDEDESWMQILSKDGESVGAPVLLASRPGEACFAIGVAWDGGGYDVYSIWNDRSLRFVRTGPDAVPRTEDLLVVDAADGELRCLSAAASPVSALAAVWVHRGDDGWTELSVVDLDGRPLRTRMTIAHYGSGPPDAEWDGGQFGVLTFGETVGVGGLYLARLATAGELLGPPSLLAEGAGGRALALAAGLGWAAATTPRDADLVLVRADTAGRVVQRLAMTGPGWDTLLPWAVSLAFDGDGFGFVGMGRGVGADPPLFARFALDP